MYLFHVRQRDKAKAQHKDSIAMYGVIDTVQVVSQRIQHANEANAGAKVSRMTHKLCERTKPVH